MGSALGMLAAGPLSDWWIVWVSRRNRGVYEPEFRLVFLFSLLVGALGYVGWAIGNEHHMPWIGAVACLAYVPSPSSSDHPLSRTPHGSNLTSVSRLTCQDTILQHARCRCDNDPILNRRTRRQRNSEHHMPRRLRQEHHPLFFGFLCKRHRPLHWHQSYAPCLRGLPGCMLAHHHPDVRVWKTHAVVRECLSKLFFLSSWNLLRPGMMLGRSPGILNFSTETFSHPVPRRRRRHLRWGPMRRTKNTIGNLLQMFVRWSCVTLCYSAVRSRDYHNKDRIVVHARLSMCFEMCVQMCIQI